MQSLLDNLVIKVFLITDKISSFFVLRVFAAAGDEVSVGVKISDKTKYATWGDYLSDIYRFAMDIGYTLAVLMIVWSGFMYMTSQGDSTKINTAKDITIGALVGMAMLYTINFLARVLSIRGIATGP